MDNCPSHLKAIHANSTIAIMARENITPFTFPPNATHLCQPCDSFVISKIKEAWGKRWDKKKYEMTMANVFQEAHHGNSSGSGIYHILL
jgi:hypothetical protein